MTKPVAALSIRLEPLAGLKPARVNPRTHSPLQVDQLADAMREFGWTQPILYDFGADETVAGHGRQAAAASIYAKGEVIRLPSGEELPKGTVPVIDVTGWTDDQRRAYLLADNQLATQAGWDIEALGAELAHLETVGFNMDAMGFSALQVDEFLGRVEMPMPGSNQTDSDFAYHDQYGVIVVCRDEAHQQEVYERLFADGLDVKVVVT